MISSIDSERCTGCGICVEVCPLDTLRLDPFREEMPTCQQACPVGVNVRACVYYLKQGMVEETGRTLMESLPFPAITGRLCAHPCEVACARAKVDEAVSIRALERYVGDKLLGKGTVRHNLIHAGKVAIIGSGPAGLAAAYFLCRKGYSVTVFEANREPGGSLREEVRAGRLPEEILTAQISFMREMGVSFENGIRLSKETIFGDLRDARYGAIFLAPGVRSELTEQMITKEKEAVLVDPATPEITVKGLFASGVMSRESLPLIKVIGSAKKAALSIDRFLRGQDPRASQAEEFKRIKRAPREGLKTRKRFEAPEGFGDEAAQEEARRCMSCGSLAYIAHPEDCMTCFECEVECPSNAIKVHPFKEVLPMTLAID